MRGEGISDSENEEEGGDGIPKVARAPHGRPRGTTMPKARPSQQREASSKDASADLCEQKPQSLLASPASPEHMSGDEDSSDDEVYTDPLHHIPQQVVQPLLIPQLPMHQHWKTIVQYSLIMLAPQKVNLHLKCPILSPHNLIRQLIVFSYTNHVLWILVVVKIL